MPDLPPMLRGRAELHARGLRQPTIGRGAAAVTYGLGLLVGDGVG